jgi:hypothetical protein
VGIRADVTAEATRAADIRVEAIPVEDATLAEVIQAVDTRVVEEVIPAVAAEAVVTAALTVMLTAKQ